MAGGKGDNMGTLYLKRRGNGGLDLDYELMLLCGESLAGIAGVQPRRDPLKSMVI